MEPNFFIAFGHGLLLQSFADSKKEDIHEEEMEANEQVGAGASKNEKREEVPAMTASSSPTHTSAEDIFSDTMELANYLHRRVQEIGKQFRHRPFRINASEKVESAPEFIQGPSRAASEPSLASAIARACEPGELAIARENAESCLREEGGVPSLIAEMKPSSASCLSKRDWSMGAEMKHNERPFSTEMKTHHLYDSMPSDGRACNTEELAWAHREDNFPFSSENAGNSSQRKGEDAPLKHREEKLPSVSEIAQVSICGKHRAHNQGSGMGGTSSKHANLTGFQEAVNSNTCVDAGSCPALRRAEGKNPQSQCSTPSHDSSEHLLCHASNIIPAHLPSELKLPSLQDHAISDAEDAGGLPRSIHTEIVHLQAVAENSPSPHLNVQHSMSSVDSSECDNCGNDGDKKGVSNGADGNKSEEIDAMSEALHPDTRTKEDEDGTLAELGGDASGRTKQENDALDLLLDAIHVTSAEGAAAKEGADAHQKGACLSERPGHGSIQNMLELPSHTPSLHVGRFPIMKKRSDRSAKTLAGKELSGSSVSPVARFRSLQAVSEVDLPNDRNGGKKLASNKLDDQKVERLQISDSSQGRSKGKRERTWEDALAEEDHFSKQEKMDKIIDGDDAREYTRMERVPSMPASEGDKQEQGIMLSRRARLQVLPTKFSDSVLQPWKKGDRRRS